MGFGLSRISVGGFLCHRDMNHYWYHRLYICEVGRIIGIDYGKKRCGIAVTDPLQIISQPLETVQSDQLLDYLKKYIETEEVDGIALGIPFHLDGSHSDTTEMVYAFKAQLLATFPDLPIHEVDERFTSKEAQGIVIQTVKSKKKRRNDKGLVDRISASIILESFLNKQRI